MGWNFVSIFGLSQFLERLASNLTNIKSMPFLNNVSSSMDRSIFGLPEYRCNKLRLANAAGNPKEDWSVVKIAGS